MSPWQNLTLSPMGLCEQSIMGSWVRTPANTWSNVTFILVGIFIFIKFNKVLKPTPFLWLIPFAILTIGISSFIYHASYSQELLFLDNMAMFILSSFIISINLKRLFTFKEITYWLLFIMLFIVPSILAFVYRGIFGSVLFFLLYLSSLILEVVIKIVKNDVRNYRYYLIMLGCQLVALTFWLMDRQGIVCNPQNHLFQGHFAWHTLNAISLFFLFKHYLLLFG